MTIKIAVRDVRDALLMCGDRQTTLGDGASSTRLLGQMFHQVCASLISSGSPNHACNALVDVESTTTAWRQAILDHAYQRVVAPQFESVGNQLRLHAAETMQFWTAVQELCGWLAGILWEIQKSNGNLDAARTLAICELPLMLKLREPGWTDEVELTGVADALLRLPGKPAWCIVELKIGQTAPEADAGQAALYYLIASSIDGQESADGTVALISFKPERTETLLRGDRVGDALSVLKQLIGKIARVQPKESGRRIDSTKPLSWGIPTAKHDQMKAKLIHTLDSLGISAKISDSPMVGPTFVRFLVEPGSGTRAAAFKGKAGEIALRMNLENEPNLTRNRGRIAIDIERPDRQNVLFSELIRFLPTSDPLLGNSRLLVGVSLDGTVVFADLAEPEHCHLLVAGTAGSGKSLWLRAAIGSLTETNSPDHLKLVLIDPKRNAFTAWRNSPHLLRPIVFPDSESPVEVLQLLVDEMEERYKRMEGVDDLRQLMLRDRQPLPRIVCVCDEYADLVVANKKRRDEIEQLLSRLGSKARAAGIHIVLATQRPSRDVIRGAINANLPTRIGLKVASAIEARIIETPGAEHLLGKGDLLFKAIGEPRRLQGAVVTAEELERIASQAEPVTAV